jgi:DNA-binding CsgD family transcriptional regulator
MKEIGARLGITPRTVAFHKYRAMVKLGIGSSVGLVRFAIEAGLVRDRPVVRALAVGLGAEA